MNRLYCIVDGGMAGKRNRLAGDTEMEACV